MSNNTTDSKSMREEAREFLAIVHKNDVRKVMNQVEVLKNEKVSLDDFNHVQICDLYQLLNKYFKALDKL